jgi:osmotically-inducible protein OsmY
MGVLMDMGMTLRIKAAMIGDERIKARDIHVNAFDGVVTLDGRVPYPALRQVAEDIARRHGARDVVDHLDVDEASFATPSVIIPDDAPRVTTPEGADVVQEPSLEDRIRMALAADPRINEHLIVVRVVNGIAYLSGRQDTIDAARAAIQVAAHVPDVLGVSDDLSVMPAM